MVALSSILAWSIPRTEEPGGLRSVGSHRVRHDLVTEQVCCHSQDSGNACEEPTRLTS